MTSPSKPSDSPKPEPKKTEREICLQQAIEYITKNRNKEYGEPENNFSIIAELWKPIIKDCVDAEDLNLIVVKPYHVALMLTLLKIARTLESPGKFDNWVDAAGYIGCGWDVKVQEEK